jgi:hypothetical protein
MRLKFRRGAFGLIKPLLGLFAVVVMAAPAQAAITYQYVAGQATYAASPGQAVSVPIYLRETVTGASTSLIFSENGMFGAGFSVGQIGTPVLYTLAANTAEFSGPSTVNASSLTESIAPTATAGVFGATSPGGIRDVLLGHVNLTAGSGSTTFNVARYDHLGGNTLTNTSFFDLDFPQAGASYVAVQGGSFLIAVPEPAGVAMLLIPLTVLIRRRRGN